MFLALFGCVGCEFSLEPPQAAMPLLPLISDPARTFQVGRLTDDGVLHDSVAEVIDYRRNGEDATPLSVQTFLRHGLLGLRMPVIRSRNWSHRGGGHRQPGDRASFCD